MSRTPISARHRATPTHSIALAGLAYTAKTNAVAVGKPAMIVAATGGLVLASGAAAQAGTYAENTAAAQAPAPVAAAAGTHTVAAGDTLGAISARYGVALNTVLAQNGLSYASVIYPGQQINVSGSASGSASVAVPAAVVSPAAVPAAAPATQVSYTVPAAAVAPVQAQSGVSFASSAITPVAAPAPAVAASGVGAALVASARAQIGAVQDCTILVEKALRSVGKTVGDLAPNQFYQYGTVVGSPAAGDLVITSGHVAIYVGGGKVISSGMNGANLTFEHDLSDLPGASFVRVS